MKKSVLSLLTGAALLGTVGVASAAEPMVLTNAAMDMVTAGVRQQSEVTAVAVNSSIVERGNGGGGTITVTQTATAIAFSIQVGDDFNL
jgi:hypothetical protein